ncbi:MAG: YbhB/YbcL family Raf kinase inhibitor-like protein [Burkholderiales bacterium]|nr:YbhB/YbcL family Raf kinase inhibitor-like protein [Burkholderiales bacterium]
MKLATTAFADQGVIPGEFAFAVIDPAQHVRLSTNRNPDFAWTGLPEGTRSLALVCHDPDVPSRADDVNKEGRVVPASLPRVDFHHWVLIDLPSDTPGIARGAHSDGITARGKPGPNAPREGRHGINDYTAWFAGDPDMSGNYHGYDGPCPPWNDAIPHHYVFTLYALDVERLPVADGFTGPDALRAMDGHVLGKASVTGRYTLNPAVKL